MFVKFHIVISHQFVAFGLRRFGCCSISEFFPSQHRFTNVDSSIIDDLGFDDIVAFFFQNISDRKT